MEAIEADGSKYVVHENVRLELYARSKKSRSKENFPMFDRYISYQMVIFHWAIRVFYMFHAGPIHFHHVLAGLSTI